MKKLFILIGTAMIFTGLEAKAQSPQQPVKKQTTKPVKGTPPKTDAVEIFLPIDGVPDESSKAPQKPKPTAIQRSNAPTGPQVAPRSTPSPAPQPVAPRRAGPKH
ncbi:MAG TPA: hypothetical protein VFE32_00695 [Puia sp.]|jgi:hypothetical protein|nr:hypothetical protein [Puia sp.]